MNTYDAGFDVRRSFFRRKRKIFAAFSLAKQLFKLGFPRQFRDVGR